jgi:hypothetical protein
MPRKRRRIMLAVAAIVLAVAGTAFMAGPAQAADIRPFTHWSSGKCLDNAIERGREAVVQLWDCNGSIQQEWVSTALPTDDGTACCFEFRGGLRGTCLNQSGIGFVDLQPCLRDVGIDNSNQLWRVWYAFNPPSGGGWYQQLQNVFYGTCLFVMSDSVAPANGTQMATGPCDPNHGLGQRWRI